MNIMGDPLDKQDTLFSHLAFIFRLVKGQTVAVGKACHPNTQQIEAELLSHFQDMWEAKQYDQVQLPMSVPADDLKYLFQDCCIPQAATGQVSDLDSSDSDSDVVVEQDEEEDAEEGSSESEEEGARDTTVESTDTEMMRHTLTMLISLDSDRHHLVDLSQRQKQVAEEAAQWVREEYVEEDTSAQAHSQSQSCGRVITFKCQSEERETYPHKRHESPKYGATPTERGMEHGRDVTKKKTQATTTVRPTQGSRDDDAPACSLAGGHSVFDQPPLLSCSLSKSQKRHHAATTVQAKNSTPTQSPAQKTVKLRSSIVKPADGFCLPRRAPYHMMWETPDCMITYICSLLTRAMVEDEKECMKYFGNDTASLSQQCMASALYAIIAYKVQGHRVFPEIPSRLEREPPSSLSRRIPGETRCSEGLPWRWLEDQSPGLVEVLHGPHPDVMRRQHCIPVWRSNPGGQQADVLHVLPNQMPLRYLGDSPGNLRCEEQNALGAIWPRPLHDGRPDAYAQDLR